MLSAPPASGLAFQDLGSEAEDAVAAASSEDEDDGSSSSGSEDSDAAGETEESAAARTPRSRRACVEAKASSAPPPATPKVEPVQPIVVEEKKEEEVVEPVKPPARRVDEFRPHAICKVCQVLMTRGKLCASTLSLVVVLFLLRIYFHPGPVGSGLEPFSFILSLCCHLPH